MEILQPYEVEFRSALERTLEWDLACAGTDDLKRTLALPISPEPPTPAAIARVSDGMLLPLPLRIGNCAGAHFGALVELACDRVCDPLPILTIGDVEVVGEPRYRPTRKVLRSLLRRGLHDDSRLDLHIWLTFPGGVVLDLTLGLILVRDKVPAEVPLYSDSAIIYGAADGLLPGLRYRPMLVGEAFLFRIGTLHPRAPEVLREAREGRRLALPVLWTPTA